MNRILKITASFLFSILLLTGCRKSDGVFDEQYWLSKEAGQVVYTDPFCPLYIVETNYGYTVIESESGFLPYDGSIIYGDLSRRGYMEFYNRSERILMRGTVIDTWLSYGDAQFLIDDLCY